MNRVTYRVIHCDIVVHGTQAHEQCVHPLVVFP